ncbi:putative membrane protein [Kordia periserrulae]|uniref:Putative membrane protein n=1 Tax=Kordia periserrulae TaxID=701523 RepID=A0A2T6C197_9FLAO|nr:DoxX family protein [Kordia periserrulae]PTX62104.1 putative membrane protein [Kordia periserrulae]
MPETSLTSLYIMAAIYIVAGIFHFVTPTIFLKITPKWVPKPKVVNVLVGSIEIGLGVALLFPETRSYAAIGIIALLIAVFPANWKYYQIVKRKKQQVQIIIALIRLPIQALLIYWAYVFV